MIIASKFDVEGPIGKQLSKTEYSKMLQQVDVIMQKVLPTKKRRMVKRINKKV